MNIIIHVIIISKLRFVTYHRFIIIYVIALNNNRLLAHFRLS